MISGTYAVVPYGWRIGIVAAVPIAPREVRRLFRSRDLERSGGLLLFERGLQRDSVRLVGNDGTTLVYTVTDSFIVDENDPSALNLMGPYQL